MAATYSLLSTSSDIKIYVPDDSKSQIEKCNTSSYMHCCVVDESGNYVEFVVVKSEIGNFSDANIKGGYELSQGQYLVKTLPPVLMIKAVWNGSSWEETGTRIITEQELEETRANKLVEIGKACNTTIESGFDVETLIGTEHFSFKLEDQVNIQNLVIQIEAGAESVLYHSDGNECRDFMPNEITAIAEAGIAHKTYHLTYCNHLYTWIKRETDYDTLCNIKYGIGLPEDLATNISTLMNK